MNGNRKLRKLLILQSFVPLMFLLLLKNCEFNLFNLVCKFFIRIWKHDFSAITIAITHEKFLLLIVVVGCLFWILKGILAMFQFRNVQNSNFIEGDKIVIKNYSSDAGLIFFTTFIVPLVLDDIGELRNSLVFIGLLTMIIALMHKTNLYYQNPVLTILGYKTFQFYFIEDNNSAGMNNELIGITYGKIDESKIIKYQLVADDVYLIYNKTQHPIH
ncbi:hypothetical protein Desgi_1062 [Desulfoscipio gibsoniae DSM 7213]|uniref:Uncharacterized protein n=2 Tax=Desulfoscipio gibsoniae TaxID=102134 RepID=R4KLS9_9FIRM|nr:hypothetical protein Desgi_1062 [Desulfoscipio gibsoniae DSM 7213]